jgi:tungstate transport system substrate-binding protein
VREGEPIESKEGTVKRCTVWWFVLTVSILAAALVVTPLAGCGGDDETTTTAPAEDTPATVAPENTTSEVETSDVILASTTSTQDSGLFDVLIPAFEEAYPQYVVNVVAVGTGEALKLGEQKDADVLLVHAKASEEEFVANGYGIERRDVMYNDFVIVGPADDPAGVKGMTDASDAFKKIFDAQATFISRGDDSGTHKKELAIWEEAGVTPGGGWYLETGQGMGDTLRIASEKQGYTLADRATWLSMLDALDLEIVVEGDKALFNQYGVIVVTDATNLEGGRAFADWIVSSEGQEVIKNHGVEEYGQALFVPNAAQ